MLSYEFYKVLHLSSIVILLTSLSISFFTGKTEKYFKTLNGISTLLILVGGMGLMARLGINHKEMWPAWVYIKFAIWFIIGAGGVIIVKRKPHLGKISYVLMILLFILAAITANLKFQ